MKPVCFSIALQNSTRNDAIEQLSLLGVSAAAAGRDLLLRFDLDGEQHWLHVRGGRLERPDREAEPDLVFTGSAAALIELCRGTRDLEQLGPRLSAHGSQTAKRAFTEMFPVGAVAAG